MTRIIIVDDDEDIRDLVDHRLTMMGMRVETFRDGEFGLRAILEDPPDLAIVDMMMPWKNGLDVTRAVRANEATSKVPIVILTALHMQEWRQAAHEAGSDRYMIKPFSVVELGDCVMELLGSRSHVPGRRSS